jgi:hypothetical protein
MIPYLDDENDMKRHLEVEMIAVSYKSGESVF